MAAGTTYTTVDDLNGDFWTAPCGASGGWNLYEVVGRTHGTRRSWYEAYLSSTNLDPIIGTSTGHLVAVNSVSENDFLRQIRKLADADVWLGLTDNDTNTVGVSFSGAYESGNASVPLENRRTRGWAWLNGDPYDATTFMNWNDGEPNNNPSEDAVVLIAGGRWNDYPSGIPGSGDTAPECPYVIEWDIDAPEPISGATNIGPVLPSTPLPVGGPGTDGAFSVLEVRDNGPVDDIRSAVASLLSGNGWRVEGTVHMINHYDEQDAANIHSVLFRDNAPFVGDTPSSDNDVAILFKGRIRVPESGQWTFGVHSDDGFALRMLDKERTLTWSAVSGAGAIDAWNPATVSFEGDTADADTRAVTYLSHDECYDVEFVYHQSSGGSAVELYAARGSFTNDTDTDGWRLVGDQRTRLMPTPGVDSNGWTVVTSAPFYTNPITTIAIAEEALASSWPVSTSTWNALNFVDPQSNGGGGTFLEDSPFPGNTAGDDNDFALRASANLVIPVAGVYHLGFRGDDGGYLRVIGENWARIVAGAGAGATIEGDRLIVDSYSGDTPILAAVELAPGIHQIEALFFEHSGWASYEVTGCAELATWSALPSTFQDTPKLLESNASAAISSAPTIRLIDSRDGLVLIVR